MTESIFDRYAQLKTLKGLVPDDVVEREIGAYVEIFEKYRTDAVSKIKTVNLNAIFPAELEKAGIYLENFLGHWGNVRIEEVCKIALIASFFQSKRVFEFGTFNGMTTLQIALNTPDDAKIYTLNLPPDMAKNTKYQLSELDKYISAEFLDKFNTGIGSYFKGTKVESKIIQILSDSATFDYSPFYKQMDLIFIDAGHDYRNAKSDTLNALKMVAPKGVILWHNYDDILCPDVTRYLCELSESITLFHLRNTAMAIHWNKL